MQKAANGGAIYGLLNGERPYIANMLTSSKLHMHANGCAMGWRRRMAERGLTPFLIFYEKTFMFSSENH